MIDSTSRVEVRPSSKTLVGADIELFVMKGNRLTIPKIVPEGYGSSPFYNHMDDFGHCAEIRPIPASSEREFLYNIIDALYGLPKGFDYKAADYEWIPKSEYVELLRLFRGKKEMPCNVDDDMLDFHRPQVKKGMVRIECGMHIHMSREWSSSRYAYDKDGTQYKRTEYFKEDLTPEPIVKLLDKHLYTPLYGKSKDGYRAAGYYKKKPHLHNGFEYRSIGANYFQPHAMALIFRITKYIVDNLINIIDNPRKHTCLTKWSQELALTYEAADLSLWRFWE